MGESDRYTATFSNIFTFLPNTISFLNPISNGTAICCGAAYYAASLSGDLNHTMRTL